MFLRCNVRREGSFEGHFAMIGSVDSERSARPAVPTRSVRCVTGSPHGRDRALQPAGDAAALVSESPGDMNVVISVLPLQAPGGRRHHQCRSRLGSGVIAGFERRPKVPQWPELPCGLFGATNRFGRDFDHGGTCASSPASTIQRLRSIGSADRRGRARRRLITTRLDAFLAEDEHLAG